MELRESFVQEREKKGEINGFTDHISSNLFPLFTFNRVVDYSCKLDLSNPKHCGKVSEYSIES